MIERAIAEALRRLHKHIDARWQVARGRKPSTANRSVGQLYKRKEQRDGHA